MRLAIHSAIVYRCVLISALFASAAWGALHQSDRPIGDDLRFEFVPTKSALNSEAIELQPLPDSDEPLVDIGVVLELPKGNGIGRGTLRLVAGSWPEKLVFRLPTQGLEHFRLSTEQYAWSVSVSSQDGTVRSTERVSLDSENNQADRLLQSTLLDAEDPESLRVTRYPIASKEADGLEPTESDVSAASPLANAENQGFQIHVPTEVLKQIRDELKIEWVDFYR